MIHIEKAYKNADTILAFGGVDIDSEQCRHQSISKINRRSYITRIGISYMTYFSKRAVS